MSTSHQWSDESAKSVFAAIIKRSQTDPAFRQLCLSDPAAAVREVSGIDLPAGFRLQMVDNNRANLTLVLPDASADGELSEASLESIAGGGGCLVGTCGGSAACALVTVYCIFTCGGSSPSI